MKEHVGGRKYFWNSILKKSDPSTPDVGFQLLQSPGRKINLDVSQPDSDPILSMGLILNKRGDLVGLEGNSITIRKPYQGKMVTFTYHIDTVKSVNDHKVMLSGERNSVFVNFAPVDSESDLPAVFINDNPLARIADEIGIPREFNWVDTAIAYLSGEVTAETALSSVVPLPQTELVQA